MGTISESATQDVAKDVLDSACTRIHTASGCNYYNRMVTSHGIVEVSGIKHSYTLICSGIRYRTLHVADSRTLLVVESGDGTIVIPNRAQAPRGA